MRVGWVFLAIVIEKMLVAAFQEALTKRFRQTKRRKSSTCSE